MKSIGERLGFALKVRNIRQKDFAERLGIEAVTLNRYIKGTRQPRADMMVKICKELGISADWLLGLM